MLYPNIAPKQFLILFTQSWDSGVRPAGGSCRCTYLCRERYFSSTLFTKLDSRKAKWKGVFFNKLVSKSKQKFGFTSLRAKRFASPKGKLVRAIGEQGV